MTTCTFSGHREVYHSGLKARLDAEIERLLRIDSEFLFLVGGMGQFDDMGADAVRSAKRRHPEKQITLALVLPYMSNRLNTDKEYYRLCFDQIIIPKELDAVYYKAAIQCRNRWMVDRADIVIAYLYRDFGGALRTVRYAQKKGKLVINIVEGE